MRTPGLEPGWVAPPAPTTEMLGRAASYRFLIKRLGERNGDAMEAFETFARSAISFTQDLFLSLEPQYRRRQLKLRTQGA